MTNVLLFHNEIANLSARIDDREVDTYPARTTIENILSPRKYLQTYITDQVSGGSHIRFDLGSAQTASANFIAIANFTALKDDLVTEIKLKSSSDNSTYTDRYTGTVSGMTALGRGDYAEVFTATSAYRYWVLEITSSGTSDHLFSKVFFGSYLDMGVDPDIICELLPPVSGEWVAPSGASYSMRLDESKYRIECKWEGVSDANTSTFFHKIAHPREAQGVFIYAPTYGHALDEQTLLYCRCLSASQEQGDENPDWNIIRAVFEEDRSTIITNAGGG